MYLDVYRISTESLIYESARKESPSWNYDLTVGDYRYIFYGTKVEKKIFNAFKNVQNYRKALAVILNYLRDKIEVIQTEASAQAVVVNHNFVETCKHIRDPISELLPKLSGKLSHGEKIERVAKSLEGFDLTEVAAALLDVDRTITNLQTQITGMQIIAGDYKADMRIAHSLVGLIDSLLISFDESFEEKSIRVINRNDNANSSRSIFLDYTLMNWAFYHLLNNAVKYSYSGSDFIVQADSFNNTITIEMVSLKVDIDEAQNIFEPRVRGRHSGGFSGDGLGMYFAKTSLKNMGATIKFIPTLEILHNKDGKNYCKNCIEITLA